MSLVTASSSSSVSIGNVSFLQAEGDHLVNEQGKTVVLRGVNLGGWLVEEILIFIEDGFKGIKHIPDPAKKGWKNVVFSVHIYAKGTKSESEFLAGLEKKLAQFAERQKTLKVPLYVGEFNFQPYDESDKIKKFITELQSKNISWAHWTYKFAGQHGRTSTWGLYCRPQKLKYINPFTDSSQEILIKIQQLFTLNFDLNIPLEKLFRET